MAKKRIKKEKEELIRGFPAHEFMLRGRITEKIMIPLEKTIADWNSLLFHFPIYRKGHEKLREQHKELMRKYLDKLLQARSILDEISLPKTLSPKMLSRLKKIARSKELKKKLEEMSL